MNLRGHTLQSLHEEHIATLDLLARVTQAIGAPRRAMVAALPKFHALLRALFTDLEDGLERHFLFEERHLFPVLRATGRSELADSLTEEHTKIREVSAQLLKHVRDALAEKNAAGHDWAGFEGLASRLIEMIHAHMQREEGEMVPVLRANVSAGASAP